MFEFGVCGQVTSEVRVTFLSSRAEETNGSCSQSWSEAQRESQVVEPPPLDGSLSKAALDCLSCTPKDQASRGRVLWYKAERSLYTLPQTDTGTSGYGETVNGKFLVPSAGQLFIEVKGADDVVDLWGGPASPVGGGWQSGSVRNGTPIANERTVSWDTWAPGAAYEFNLRGYRGTAPGFDVLFHWYRWDANLCCIQHEVESLGVQVLPLPCNFEGRDPVTPEMRHAANGEDGHREVRIPCCPRCDDGQPCTPGNLSGWFVTWPRGAGAQTAAVGQLLDGHALGWRFDSSNNTNTLWSPGADRLGYEFIP